MSARPTDRLYQITLRAARRTVGATVLVRGQSITLPLTADVAAYRAAPGVWDVKVVPGARARPSDPEPGTIGAPVSGRANGAFTGLVNRLAAARDDLAALPPADRDGYRAQVRGSLRPIAELLAQVLGGSVRLWVAILRLAPDAVEFVAEQIEDLLDRDDGPLRRPAPSSPPAARPAAPPPPAAGPAAPATEPEPEPEPEPEDLAEDLADLVADPRGALGQYLLKLQVGDPAATLAGALELARAAGLAVGPELSRIRKRDVLAAALAGLLSPSASAPNPSELEG